MRQRPTASRLRALFVLLLLAALPLAGWLYLTRHFRAERAVMASLPNGSKLTFAGDFTWLPLPRQLRKIRSIDLSEAKISDQQLIQLIPQLQQLRSLERIHLSGQALPDATVERLGAMDQISIELPSDAEAPDTEGRSLVPAP